MGAARVVGSATPKVIRKPPVKAGEIATPTGPAVVAMKMRTTGGLRGAATATRAAGPEMSTKAIGALLLTKDAVTEVGSATQKDILRLPVRAGKIVVPAGPVALAMTITTTGGLHAGAEKAVRDTADGSEIRVVTVRPPAKAGAIGNCNV